ncbi:hypothetical protein P4637_11970 [Halalkalibacterium halodurans]|uniref:hypothetical protein n=1 Tax=Halalkalibacterium halodurans TaxID=86665 RepID=UPI002E204530|nr:hypothetical protein [Halalkalibacterium halodurans]MED4085530.1 hypothetical protein [Halalkalibacterium halodurans]MED4103422.1 hypothetical protein [Halalkalibacterium halodurans]MED4110144.1 hypothetical protein [Halalkalibacterium halodurans]MED4124172.1 hypothetical protein [Halalkalibacterium halodurans]
MSEQEVQTNVKMDEQPDYKKLYKEAQNRLNQIKLQISCYAVLRGEYVHPSLHDDFIELAERVGIKSEEDFVELVRFYQDHADLSRVKSDSPASKYLK